MQDFIFWDFHQVTAGIRFLESIHFIEILRFWLTLFIIGIIFLPFTKLIFKNSPDSFYIFSKVFGIVIISYTIFVTGTLHALPFNIYSTYAVVVIAILFNVYLLRKYFKKKNFRISKIMVFEEVLFFIAFFAWSFIRSHEPSIQSLEKFMDYGFVNSILRASYFPPPDMWFTPFPINYYFFGHLATAVITRISMTPPQVSYNLMIAAIFAFTFTGGFSLVFNFLEKFKIKKAIAGGILGGFLLACSGNLHTIYSLFTSYSAEHPVPFWQLAFLPNTFPNGYWYPNATRFIPFTIHEFPLYSFVVSDLHGHVLDIPFVLTTIAIIFTILKLGYVSKVHVFILSFFLAVMYMTNVWDGIIYLGLSFLVIAFLNTKYLLFQLKKKSKKIIFPYISKISGVKKFLFEITFMGGLIIVFYFIFSLPFSIFFKPFVSGIGIVCAPEFLTNIGKIGPFLFEKDHCQKSALYQLLILYGFFIFFAGSLLLFFATHTKKLFIYSYTQRKYSFRLPQDITHIFMIMLILISTLLILAPEFLYAKDIYPAHYRANTMFKLVYQAFIMLSLVSGYSIVFLINRIKNIFIKVIFMTITFILLFLVCIYPYFAVTAYYNNLRTVKGLDGNAYMLPDNIADHEVIMFLNKNVKGQPVILEAQGDSYTNFGRISANTGLPTILGWTVHEWLWRGSYDIPAPRITEIEKMYQGSFDESIPLLKKYNVSYVIVGKEEKNKYKVNTDNFDVVGKVIFDKFGTKIYFLSL